MSDKTELFKLHASQREKFANFLMASAGAATGFCITLRDALALSWPDALVILASALFALSFWAGIKAATHTHHILYVNAKYLEDLPGATAAGFGETFRERAHLQAFEPISKRIARWGRVQIYSLALGAGCLMLWRVALAYPEFHPERFL